MSISSGYGYGYGSGYGSGYGDGYGSGLKAIGQRPINIIDGVPTIIESLRGNVAKGYIVKGDLTLEPCYIVKQNNKFAHGADLHSAMEALREKLFEGMSEEERIEEFFKTFQWGINYPNEEFFIWHNRLTGSCEMGRRTFAADHGVDLSGTMTVEAFIALTRDAYGGDIIKQLEQKYLGG